MNSQTRNFTAVNLVKFTLYSFFNKGYIMKVEELIKHVERIKETKDSGALTEAMEITRTYLGADNSFYKQFVKINR